MVTSADIIAFLEARGITAPIADLELPELPDEAVLVEVISGLSSTYEMAFDRPAIRVTVRGKQGSQASAQALAGAVDNALLSPAPIAIGGKHVTNLQRLTGPPGYVGMDARSGARRPVYQATYVPEIAR